MESEPHIAWTRSPITAPERLGCDCGEYLQATYAQRVRWLVTLRYTRHDETMNLHHPRLEYVCSVPLGSVLSAGGSSP